MKNKKKSFTIIIVLLLVFGGVYFFGGFGSQAVALDVNYYSQSDCDAAMVTAYGGSCDSCKVRCSDSNVAAALSGQTYVTDSNGDLVDISMCEVGGGLGNLVQWYGDASYCETDLVADGVCSPSVVVSENCQSATGHIDSRCSSGVRCGEGSCYSTVYASDCYYDDGNNYICYNDCGQSQIVSTGCAPGGEWLSMNVPSAIKPLDSYVVTGRFRADCGGEYYLEAYQHKGTFQPFAVVTSDVGQCDDNEGTAGDYVVLSEGEFADVTFTLQDYGQLGSYEVVLGAFAGCGAAAYDSDSMVLSVSNDGTTTSPVAGFDWLSIGLIGGLTVFGVILFGVVIIFIARRKK